ncbi:histone deacetylase [Trypanosoma cruzi cruzi]|nr:histone deacetylase [Trypanosoma cruzi cruzi]
MPKRSRAKKKVGRDTRAKTEQVNGASEAVATIRKVGLETYIRNWMSEADGARPPLPSSLPSLTSFPTILDVMMGVSSPSTPEEGAMNATGPDAKQKDGRIGRSAGGTGVVYDDVMLQHESTDPTDYERPGRLKRTLEHLRAIGLLQCCRRISRHVARTKELRLVHSIAHIDSVDQLEVAALLRHPETSYSVGQDLYANTSTSKAARMAVGCVIAAALSVVRGEVMNAFALVRPPGHHASVNEASGFCFFNNVAVAVRVAQQELRQRGISAPRALVFDWDVHHCDGTESIFYEDPSVVVVSIHQHGTGRGHVLRKAPTVFTDTIDLDALAALMEETTGEEATSNGDNGHNASVGGDDWHQHQTREEEKEEEEEEEEEAEKVQRQNPQLSPEEEGDGRKRAARRKPVDYVKMAADLEEDDEAIARMFGISPEDLKKSSSSFSMSKSSDGGGGSSSIGSRSSSSHFSSPHLLQKNLPGDTEGLSLDEDIENDKDGKFYPGTGHVERVGGDTRAEARGKNINIPWPTLGMGDLEYLQVFLDIVAPVVREYEPHIVFLSCGFDSAAGDLLGSMCVSPSGYYLLTKAVSALCPHLVVALEGGYNLSNVARCSEAVMRALLESSGTAPLPHSRMLWYQTEELVKRIRQRHEGYWRCFSHPE